jgi:hypothetical protein
MIRYTKQTNDFHRGVQKGFDIAREMLCDALKEECDSLGVAIAKVDLLVIDKKIMEERMKNNG